MSRCSTREPGEKNREQDIPVREAARAAIEPGAPPAGAELLGRAPDEPPSPGERVTVLREAGRAEALAGSEAACARLEEALRLTRACVSAPR
jgi:hypothetical protein